ncbi:hypothetical protein [Aeromonas dhakensis]|uniref:hypothetical protein n=1 Tax=Aeromonas dhakensis TaxID=196024 RepID=UPI001F608F06|nr:hypothetical protein [Aeromonas dhakensis]
MRNAINWVVGCCLLLVCAIALAAEPPVKKSRNGICHPKGGTYYSLTKHYTPYDSMQACLDSGGRAPKR